MASAIDATQPVTGVAVSKALQRANWLAAKTEIEALQAGGLKVWLGRTTDSSPIATITQTHANAMVLVNQNVTINSFTVPTGTITRDAPYVSIANTHTASISVTPSGCTIDGTTAGQSVAAGGELVLVALATGQFHIQGGGADVAGETYSPTNVTATTYTLVLADRYLRVNVSSSTVTITVPTNASVAFALGTEVQVEMVGSGRVDISGAGGVTILNAGGSGLVKTGERGRLKLVAADTWNWSPAHQPVWTATTVAGTSETIGAGNNYSWRVYTSASPITVTVASSIPSNYEGVFRKAAGAGTLTLSGSGVTFNGNPTYSVVDAVRVKREGTATDLVVYALGAAAGGAVKTWLGRSTDQSAITTITQTHENAMVLVDQNVTISAFTVPAGTTSVAAPWVSIANQSVASINITPNIGCTIEGSAGAQPVGPGAELVLLALATGQFFIQGGGAGSSAVWGLIGGQLADQADLITKFNTKADLANPTFSTLVTFNAGNRTVTGAPVSGAITLANHSGGTFVTGGAVTVPNQTGFTVAMIGGGSHSVGAGGTPVSLAVNDLFEVWCPAVGNVRYRKTTAAGVVTVGTLPVTVTTFDARVTALHTAVPNSVIGYWKFQGGYAISAPATTAGINGTVTGSPDLTPATIVHFDTIAEGAASDGTCIALSGTGQYVNIPHATALKSATGTMIIFFQQDTRSGIANLIAADQNAAAGGFALQILSEATFFFYVRDASAQLDYLMGTFAVQLGQAYCLMVRWGSPELQVQLFDANGVLIDERHSSTAINLSPITGISPYRIGAGTGASPAQLFDGLIARMIWLNRRISDAERDSICTQARTIVHA